MPRSRTGLASSDSCACRGRARFRGPAVAIVTAERDADVEASIAVDPRAPRRIVAAWMQDDGRSNLVMTSRDGGRTWTRVFVPGLTDCTGGTLAGAADPWLSFAPAGKLLMGSGIAKPASPAGPDVRSAADAGREPLRRRRAIVVAAGDHAVRARRVLGQVGGDRRPAPPGCGTCGAGRRRTPARRCRRR